MLRISAKQIPIFLAYREKCTQNTVKSAISNIPNHTWDCHDIILNLTDFVDGCLMVDCYSRYTADFPMKVFREAKYFIEELAITGNCLEQYQASFFKVLSLFIMECCSVTIWINSFIKDSYRECCISAEKALVTDEDRKRWENANKYIDKVNTMRVIPTLPKRLIANAANVGISICNTWGTYPQARDILEVVGWVSTVYPSTCSQDTDLLYRVLSVESCAQDEYSSYMFGALSTLMRNQDGNSSIPLFSIKEAV